MVKEKIRKLPNLHIVHGEGVSSLWEINSIARSDSLLIGVVLSRAREIISDAVTRFDRYAYM